MYASGEASAVQTQSDMWYVIANLEETQTEMCRSVYNSTFLVLHANMPRNRMRVTHALHILLWLRSSSLTRDYHRFDGADPVLPPPKHGHRLTTHTSRHTTHSETRERFLRLAPYGRIACACVCALSYMPIYKSATAPTSKTAHNTSSGRHTQTTTKRWKA